MNVTSAQWAYTIDCSFTFFISFEYSISADRLDVFAIGIIGAIEWTRSFDSDTGIINTSSVCATAKLRVAFVWTSTSYLQTGIITTFQMRLLSTSKREHTFISSCTCYEFTAAAITYSMRRTGSASR